MSYELESKASGIEVGNYVKVLFKVPTESRGWENSWTQNMDDFVGKVLKVQLVSHNSGISLELDGDRYSFPYFCLEKMASKESVLPKEIEEIITDFGCHEEKVRKLVKAIISYKGEE